MPALLQCLPVAADKTANLATLRRTAFLASQCGADVLVMPELFLTGYNLGDRLAGLAEPLDGPSVAAARAIARETRTALVFGLPERDGYDVYNTSVAIDRDGSLAGRYRKIQLFGDIEPTIFTPGDRTEVVTLAGLKVGLAICYDIEFPEIARSLKRAGAELICVPTANMTPFIDVPTTLVRARALENGVPVVYANLAGAEGDLAYTGLSGIIGFDGRDIARAGASGEVFLACRTEAIRAPAAHPMLSTQHRDLKLDARAAR
ncbi:carbon-nitrogen hydrolase family protein [Chthonobacter albigriseus]|uniref:carbon-nitrogen hydrolase family protein n=1 Tax=Chthonobacter albigriseus TaxID=1683161 RepID=UPI0015EF6435|nr:carbon-nitrogen hydrolase family protein [Chthonobacter albigriseus]